MDVSEGIVVESLLPLNEPTASSPPPQQLRNQRRSNVVIDLPTISSPATFPRKGNVAIDLLPTIFLSSSPVSVPWSTSDVHIDNFLPTISLSSSPAWVPCAIHIDLLRTCLAVYPLPLVVVHEYIWADAECTRRTVTFVATP